MEIPVIIEIACNHEGNLKRFGDYIDICRDLKNASLKYQIFNPKSLCHKSYKFIDDLKKVAISFKDWREIINYSFKNKINLWLEPFDKASLNFVSEFPHQKISIKIPSCDVPHINPEYLKNFKQVGLAIGGIEFSELKNILPLYKKKIKNLILFHGYQAFPTTISDRNFMKMQYISNFFELPVFYADHTQIMDDESIKSTLLESLQFGAKGIERHICLDYSDKFDIVSASNPQQIKEICEYFMDIEIKEKKFNSNIDHNEIIKMASSEKSYREAMLKKIISTKDFKKGDKFLIENFEFKRATSKNHLLSVELLKLVKGQNLYLKNNFKKDQILNLDDI